MLAQTRLFNKQRTLFYGPGPGFRWKYAAGLMAASLLELTPLPIYAESVKLVQWWDAYFPSKEQTVNYQYRSSKPHSVQYQDVNQDGIYNDALVWYELSAHTPLNPLPRDAGKPNDPDHQYRIDRPSARFYGGVVARFVNVSNLTEKDRQTGARVPAFTHFQQASVQPTEGARPCSYSSRYPHQTIRAGSYDSKAWADMTVMVINEGGKCCPLSQLFQKNPNTQVNFTAAYLWKKADFLNRSAKADQITFDQDSQLSVDITRFRKNVEEVRFLVQDGDQLWISEGTTQVITTATGEVHWTGVEGVEVEDFGGKFGAIVQLHPTQSRWAPYQPVAEEQIQTLAEAIQQMEYDPQKASPQEEQLHHDQSDKLLQALNQMEFSPSTATFVEHTFTDVQAVGVYFATYQFSHQVTKLVFDNFQAYGSAELPKDEAIAISPQGDIHTSSHPHRTQFAGGVSVNEGVFEQRLKVCSCDQVAVRGDLTVVAEDVGKSVDLIAYAISKTSPESREEIFYALNSNRNITFWDKQPDKLIPFQTNVMLQPEHTLDIYQGQLAFPGFLQIHFGYRLPDGMVVTSADSIDVLINGINQASSNEMPYCESISRN